MTRTIVRREIPSTDPRLKRHIHHDSESRRYTYDTAGLLIVSAKHTRRIPVLDQGQLGSCTGNAGIGCLGTSPFFETMSGAAPIGHTGRSVTAGAVYSLDEVGAVRLYSDATRADDYPGQYPPTDTGSDGLTIAKVLKAAGEISGYQHTFTLDDALKALGRTPVITGVTWYNSMFEPAPDGFLPVVKTSGVAGGHEFVLDEIDAENKRVWLTNSWGESWGVNGRAYLEFDDFGELLADEGDATIFVPLTQPAPTPTPDPVTPSPDDADRTMATVARSWAWERHTSIAHNNQMARALRAWLFAKGL